MTKLSLIQGVAFVVLSAASAHAASLTAAYYQVPNGTGGDFGPCCSSPPGTLPVIALGSSLFGGLPVTTLPASSGGVIAQSASGQIEWWSPSLDSAVTYTGTGPFTLGTLNNMFAPNSTGTDNSQFYETAVISGNIYGTGADAKITVGSDDDALVYVDGLYVGGNPGVHSTQFTTIDLGLLSGKHSLEVFYADRAEVAADLEISTIGVATPEPAAWALMLVGFGLAGAGLRARRRETA